MSRVWGLACWVLCAACGTRALSGSHGSSGGSTGDATTGVASATVASGSSSPDATTTTTTATATTTTTTIGDEASGTPEDETGCSFICDYDLGPGIEQCDPFGDACPEGQKCVWYVDRQHGSQRRDAARCIPVVGDVPPFYPCTLPNGIGPEITDDCDASSYCLEVYGTANEGFCAPYPEDGCSIYPGTQLAIEGGSNFPAACLFYECNPLDPTLCADGMTCMFYPAFLYGSRMCWFAPDAVSLPIGSACEYASGCGDGRVCFDASVLPECADDRCCTQWCDLDAPVCDDPTMVCEPFPTWSPEKSALGACVPPGAFGR